MPEYTYNCELDGEFRIVKKMSDAENKEFCPDCGQVAHRVYHAPPVSYHTDGFYNTDYKGVVGSHDKQRAIQKDYEKKFGRPAPPPAKDVPKSGSEPF